MTRQYPVEEANRDFAEVIEEVEHGARIEVTRGGHPVAVLVRWEEGAGSEPRSGGFWSAYEAVRTEFDLSALGIDPDEVFAGVRDRTPGRDFSR